MVKKAIWILSVLLMVALSTAIVLRNSEQITVRLAPGWETSHNTGVVLLAVFFLGVLATCLAWAYFGLKAFLREKRLERRERHRQNVYELLLRARGLLAAGDWEKARRAWEQLLKRDATDVVAQLNAGLGDAAADVCADGVAFLGHFGLEAGGRRGGGFFSGVRGHRQGHDDGSRSKGGQAHCVFHSCVP